ncbi:MAG: phage tail protein [Cyanobacteriota bacterium]|nr:phage tail protein [Cyanobacteriota bacterium]
MASRDANDATWYVLRYPEDFLAPSGQRDPEAPFRQPSLPYLADTLLFDDHRGVLELRPEAARVEADPPTGMAIDVSGVIYHVDNGGSLLVTACDGRSRPLFREPGILAQPAGLALDCRGFLFVADPAARRVVVALPEEGGVRAILAGGGPVGVLEEPVDVAVAPGGRIYVADRAAGRIVVFSAGLRPLASWPTAAAPGRSPRPIAVMVESDGAVLVADGWLPRPQRYDPGGARLADRELASLLAPLAGGALAMEGLRRAYGERMPRFVVGRLGPCASPADDGGARLAEAHRALRLLSLNLGRRFATEGVFLSRALDGGQPGVTWHRVRVEFNGTPPPEAEVVVETLSADDPQPPPDQRWFTAPGAGGALAFTPEVPEQLVQSPPGRYLWLRVTLRGRDGQGTPSLRAIRAWHPRVSYLDLLPALYRREAGPGSFLEHFLALFEQVFTGIEDRYDDFSRQLNLEAAPREVIDWLAALVDLSFDPTWPLERRRALVGEAMDLYRRRGTVAGLERYVEIYTGRRPSILEGWLERPSRPALLGRGGAVLGCGLPMLGRCSSPAGPPDQELWRRYAHRFTLVVVIDDPRDRETTLRVVERIVAVNKPAHTAHRCEVAYADARVGVQSRVGIDLVVGAAPELAFRVAPAGLSTATSLGRGTVLGSEWPSAARRLEE